MSKTAEELVDLQIVFVLAQKPKALNVDTKIASLCPLMIYESGEELSQNVLPTNGYARWFKVPTGNWTDGELIIGVLKRIDERNGFGELGKEWYQVYGDSGERNNGRLIEIVDVAGSSSDLRSISGKQQLNRVPTNDFYVCCDDALVGPFKATITTAGRLKTAVIDASDQVEGRLEIYDRKEFEQSAISVINVDKVLWVQFHSAHRSLNVFIGHADVDKE